MEPNRIKRQLLPFLLVLAAGGAILWFTQPNPYASPQETFRTALKAIEGEDAAAAWECVTWRERQRCKLLGKRLLRQGVEGDVLQRLFREGLRRAPGVKQAELLSADPDPQRDNLVHVRIGVGQRTLTLTCLREGGEWRFDGLSEQIVAGGWSR